MELSEGRTASKWFTRRSVTARRSPASSPLIRPVLSAAQGAPRRSIWPYIWAVDRLMEGLQRTNQHSGSFGSFKSRSPLPRTSAVVPRTQKGTSLPRRMAHFSNWLMGSCGSYSCRRPRSTAAASLLPPPRPACMGIRFSRWMARPGQDVPVSCRNRRAARTQRFVSSQARPGTVQVMVTWPVSVSSSVTVSKRPTEVITDARSW